jgi:O-antigen/teichoic acid export membrane protein
VTRPEPDPRPARRTVGAGASLATASQVATAVAGGVLGLLVARFLGAGDTGSYTLLVSAVLILTVVAGFGLETGLSYHVAGRRWSPRDALWQTQLAALVLGTAVAAIAFGLARLLGDSVFRGLSATELAIGFAALPFAVAWTISSFLAMAGERYEASAALPAAQAALSVLLTVALVPPFDLAGALAAITIAHAAVALGALVHGARRHGRPERGWLRRAPGALGRAAAFGSRNQASVLLQLINQRAELFVLNAVAARSSVGHLSVALSVTTVSLLAPRALASVLLPRVAALDAEAGDREERDMVIGKAARQSVVLVLAVGAVVAVALVLVPLIYGGEFRESVALGFILLPGVAVAGIAGILGTLVVALGRPNPILRIALGVTPVTLLLYATLIPAYEATGAAVAAALSYVATFVWTLVVFRRAWPGRPWRELVPRREDLRDYVLLVRRARSRSTAS